MRYIRDLTILKFLPMEKSLRTYAYTYKYRQINIIEGEITEASGQRTHDLDLSSVVTKNILYLFDIGPVFKNKSRK